MTAVVRHEPVAPGADRQGYPAVFRATLTGRWFLKLVNPVPVTAALQQLYDRVIAAADASTWSTAIAELREAALDAAQQRRPEDLQGSLFAGGAASPRP